MELHFNETGTGNTPASYIYMKNLMYLSDIRSAMCSGGFIIVASLFKDIDSEFCDLVCRLNPEQLDDLAKKAPPLVNLESKTI